LTQCKYDGCDRAAEAGKSRCRTCRRADKSGGPRVVQPGPMRVLLIDIETSPNLGYVWSLWQQNVGLSQLVETTEMMCFAAKWLGEPNTMFYSEYGNSQGTMVRAARSLLDAADVVMHYNGASFDVPHLNREFVTAGLNPPSPFKQIDLLRAVRKNFRFPSNKLQYVSTALGLEGKAEHEGFDLWKKCMADDPDAWARMERYNRQDVTLLEELYEKLLPWVPSLPNRHLYGDSGCPACGSDAIERNGYAYTGVSKFPQYRCGACGTYFRSNRRESGVGLVQVVR
jgi:DNA polymerase elongation subunit (family B)